MPNFRDYQPGELVPGTVYQVARVIARGGMGTVYDVEDTTIGKRYVLKTLHPQLGTRTDLAKRMQAEARALARLNHPNIVEVVTAGVTADELRLPYYVMERLNGQNLRVVLQKKGALELSHAYHIAIDLLDALDHAHDKGVVHRDVKPENIFLHKTATGITVTKLLDFGIMTMLDAESRATGNRFLGTLRYASPEQLRGDKPSPKMDIYTAALVLYEMVAGRGPFDDEEDPHKAAAAHLHRDPPRVSQFVSVPVAFEALVHAALDKDPDRRPRDAMSFAAQLRNLKGTLGAVSAGDGTEMDAAAAALGHAASTTPVSVAVRTPPPAQTPFSPRAAPPAVTAEMPRATLRGMASPSVPGATPEQAVPSSTAPPASRPEPPIADRVAPSGGVKVEAAWKLRHGTEPVVAAPSHDIRWSPDRPADRGESGQVRSVQAAALRPSVPIVLALVALVAAASGMVLVVWKVAHKPAPAIVPAVIPTLVPSEPALPHTTPTIAPPGLEAPPAWSGAKPASAPPRPTLTALPLRPAPPPPSTTMPTVTAKPSSTPAPARTAPGSGLD